MKKLLFAALATLSMCAAVPVHADVWTLLKNSQLEEKEQIAQYRVPALGFDVRVYEWSPVSNPDKACVIAFGQTHPVGMQCFEKPNKTNK